MVVTAERDLKTCWDTGHVVIERIAHPLPVASPAVKLTVDGVSTLLSREETLNLVAMLQSVSRDG